MQLARAVAAFVHLLDDKGAAVGATPDWRRDHVQFGALHSHCFFGAAGEIANVTHAFQPSGRFSAANSQYAFTLIAPCILSPTGKR